MVQVQYQNVADYSIRSLKLLHDIQRLNYLTLKEIVFFFLGGGGKLVKQVWFELKVFSICNRYLHERIC